MMDGTILIVTTGGTIVSPKTSGGAAPDAKRADDITALAVQYFESRGARCAVSKVFGESGVDSSDLGPVQWVRLSREIAAYAKKGLQGVLIIHGTDTMAFTAAWLSLCFGSLGIPIVLTGSQRTPDSVPFDGTANVLAAAAAIEKNLAGVWICFDWKLHKGRRVHKKSAAHIDAFASLGEQPLELNALVKDSFATKALEAPKGDALQTILSRPDEEIQAFAAKVRTHLIAPGQAFLCGGGEKILLLCGYGVGNAPQAVHAQVEQAYATAKPFVIACSQAELGEKNPVAYKNTGIGGLARRGFRVWSQGDYPLEFVTALANFALLSGRAEEILSQYLKKIG